MIDRARGRLVAAATILTIIGLPAAPAGAAHDIGVDFEDPDYFDDDPEDDPSWPVFVDVRDDDARTDPTRGFLGQGMRVTIPAWTNRGTGGLAALDPSPDEAWFRYLLRLDQWNADSSGKLPGLAGLYGSSARGCIPSEPGNPGWSARSMFEATGTEGADPGKVRLGTYLYHLGQQGSCGDQILWDPGIIEQDRWYCVEGHVRVNTPGSADGLVEGWVDRTQVLRWPGLELRRADETEVGVRHFWLNIYFGGTVTNPTDLVSSIDQVVFSHLGRVGCPDPFLDDNGNPHEPDLNELHARGVMYGCGERAACPERLLIRAEMATLLTRALGSPAGPDAFTDDEGHWAEEAINAAAAAGITKGCAPGLFCPDDLVTRAEMAAFLQRAFDLEPGPDAFTDDEGHWAEEAINAVAAAGITKGCGDGTSFCPDHHLPRSQAATLLRRALGFSLPPETLDFATGVIGEKVKGGGFLDDHAEPAPQLD